MSTAPSCPGYVAPAQLSWLAALSPGLIAERVCVRYNARKMRQGEARVGPPVAVGDRITIVPEGLGERGEGVARYRGFAVFVDGAMPGDKALTEIVQVKPNYARGRAVKILSPAPHRVEPRCAVYRRCGGCQLQEMTYDEQLRWKNRMVADAFTRLGGLSGFALGETLGAEKPWFYRNKALFPVGRAAGRGGREEIVAGLYARGSHRIVDIDHCPVQHPLNNEILAVARELLRRYGYPPYEEKDGTGLVRHLLARAAAVTGQALAGVIVNGPRLPGERDFARELMRRLPALRGVVLNVNTRRTNVILGEKTRVLAGAPVIEDRLGDLVFRISARSFFQVNPDQALLLYRKVAAYAELTGAEVVIDAYGGTGAIALFLARRARWVVGIEEVSEAVADARQNARRNGIGNAEFLAGKVEEVLRGPAFPRLASRRLGPQVVILDPPRAGAEREALEAIAELRPERIVYVSCNPATLARDLAFLQGYGYRTVEAQPVDMFPQTTHVEVVAKVVREPAAT